MVSIIPLCLITFLLILAPDVIQGNTISGPCVHCNQYVEATAAIKGSIMRDKIVSTEYPQGKLRPWMTLCQSFSSLRGIDFNNMFDRFSDERPTGLRRFFHETGIVAMVQFEAAPGHGFTGLFKGAEHGLLRFSPIFPIMKERYLSHHFIGTIISSFGLKLFRDSIHSGNIMTGDTFKGLNAYTSGRKWYDLPDFNIFSRPLDTMSGIGDTLDPLFGKFEKFSGVLSLADVAAYDQEGNQEESPKTPFITHFEPNPDFKKKFARGPSLDFRKWATTEDAIPTGTVLYTVWTTMNSTTSEPTLCVDEGGVPHVYSDVETHCPDQQRVLLGNVITMSRFYVSQWVDENLNFQHTRMCPKDQCTCVMDDPVNNPPPDLTEPYTIYPDRERICVSSNDKSGTIAGVGPDCPIGSSIESDYCYPSDATTSSRSGRRVVEETQAAQCPFMNNVRKEILTDAGGSTREAGCDFFGVWQTKILTFFLRFSALGIRAALNVYLFFF